MFDFLLNDSQKKIRDEVCDFVRWVPREMVLDMDADRIRFPKAFLKEAGRRHLLGCRYPGKWGGRDMDWVTSCVILEEIGTLGYEFACVRCGGGTGLRRHYPARHGRAEGKICETPPGRGHICG